MKKFLLIPATFVTALLAVAFVSPAAASSAVRAVVPALHLVGASTSTLVSGNMGAPGAGVGDGDGMGSIVGATLAELTSKADTLFPVRWEV